MRKISLAKKIFIALILGCVCGIIFNLVPKNFDILLEIINLIGQIFTNLIKSMVVPLVFVSIALGIALIGDLKKLGSVGSKIIAFYFGTTALAVSFAIFFAKLINPDTSFYIKNVPEISADIHEKISVSKIILDIIPTNPIEALAKGSMLQIIFFAILIGIGITLANEKGTPVKKLFESLNEINLKLVAMIMNFAPIGVFALITYSFASFGLDIIPSISKYLFVTYLALFFHAVVIYNLMLKIWTKLDIKKFWKKFWPVAGVAFSTSSSNAALPISIEAADKMGVSRDISSFTLSLGSTINMNGTAIMHGITVIFLANVYHIDLNISDLIKVVLMSTLASVGTAGVPGVGMLMLAMVLELANIPVSAIGLVLGIDRILDAGRTVVNVMGDCVCTLIVAVMENDLDEKKFNADA